MPGFFPPGGRSPLQWLKFLMRGDPATAERLFHVPVEPDNPFGLRVAYDVGSEIGGTPNGMEIGYRGASVLMSPEEFLQLARPLGEGPLNSFVTDAMAKGLPVAPPQLYIKSPLEEVAEVSGHEGRNRMEWLRRQGFGGVPVLVQLQPRGESFRARSLNPERIRSFFNPVQSERGILERLRRPGAGVLRDEFFEYATGGIV